MSARFTLLQPRCAKGGSSRNLPGGPEGPVPTLCPWGSGEQAQHGHTLFHIILHFSWSLPFSFNLTVWPRTSCPNNQSCLTLCPGACFPKALG